MARAKKLEVTHISDVPEQIVRVTPLNHEFGREDLNLIRDKINEIIKHIG